MLHDIMVLLESYFFICFEKHLVIEDPSFLSTHWAELDNAMNKKNGNKYKVRFHSLCQVTKVFNI